MHRAVRWAVAWWTVSSLGIPFLLAVQPPTMFAVTWTHGVEKVVASRPGAPDHRIVETILGFALGCCLFPLSFSGRAMCIMLTRTVARPPGRTGHWQREDRASSQPALGCAPCISRRAVTWLSRTVRRCFGEIGGPHERLRSSAREFPQFRCAAAATTCCRLELDCLLRRWPLWWEVLRTCI